MMKKYLLDSSKAFSYFKENLFRANELCNAILELLEVRPGAFYAFLPENMSSEEIHDFSAGGKTSSLRKEISLKLTDIINSDSSFSCVFDDFNSDLDCVSDNDLYQSHGIHYQREIYYQIYFGSNQEIVSKCLNYSSAVWHSLCIVFKNDFEHKVEKKEMDRPYIQMMCRNAIFIMIQAYDSESYIYWYDSEGAEVLKNV